MLANSVGGGGNPPRNTGRTIFLDRIKDAMYNGTDSYRDIDNMFSPGGRDGSGSPQSTASLVLKGNSPNPKKNSPKTKKKSSYPSGGSGSGSFGTSTPSAKETFNYYEAPLAKMYGFGKETAYQEALANTAYRREMEDMRKAGLNPSVIYGSHNTSGASTNIYPKSDVSGGSGGSRRRYRGSNSGKHLFSGGAYYGVMAAVGAVTAIATKNVGAGMAAAGLTGTGLKALNGIFKK